MYDNSSSLSLVSIPNEVTTDLWLSSTSDAEKAMRLYVGFPESELSPNKSIIFPAADFIVTIKRTVGESTKKPYSSVALLRFSFNHNCRY